MTLVILTLALPARAQDAQQQSADQQAQAGLNQLLPALIGEQPKGFQSERVGSGPTPPTAPKIPAVQMGTTAEQQTDLPGGNAGAGLGALIPGMGNKPAPTNPEAPALQTFATNADYAELQTADTAVATQVISPTRIRLKDGRIVQLTGIDTPDDDPYDPGPYSIAARNALALLVEGKAVRLHVTRNPAVGRMSRLGDQLAQLELPQTGTWVQGTLLTRGLVRIRPTERNPEMAPQMIRLEDQARNDFRGLWANPLYLIKTPSTAAKALNSWAIVQGRVFSTATEKNVIYLNFGPNYHTDFTVAISSQVRREFDGRGIDPLDLTGRTVRVRGWVREYNGPFMELNNAVWLDIMPEKSTHIP